MNEPLKDALSLPKLENSAPETIDAKHRTAVLEGLAQAQRGDLATEAEVEAAFRRFDS